MSKCDFLQYHIRPKPQPEDTHDQMKIQMQALQYQIIPQTQFENTYLETTKTMQKSVQKCLSLRASKGISDCIIKCFLKSCKVMP